MAKKLWVITYDIANTKRWRQVFRLMKSYGQSVQYSVFECWLSASQLKTLQARLALMMDMQEDRVHCYPLCGQCESRTITLGQGERVAALPVVWLISDG